MLLAPPSVFLSCALVHNGKPYIFDGKGPDVFDCSGLVTYSLRAAGGPDWTQTHGSVRLWAVLAPVEVPVPGAVCLAFYGRHGVDHVMIVVGDGRVYGACGGDHTTMTLEDAMRMGARVRYRPQVHYRSDFLGYRALALKGDGAGAPRIG